MGATSQETTRLLERLGRGDSTAEDDLLQLVYGELRSMAERYLDRERVDHTLQPTALVHEAWMKLVGPDASSAPSDAPTWNDRAHFFGVAARAMRQVLVDHARARQTAKRGGTNERIPLDDALALFEAPGLELLALDEALTRFAAMDPELARLVELRFFAGLTVQETADLLDVSHRRIERGWVVARTWLHRAMGGAD